MKQTLLFLVLGLGICSINVSAQTKKRTPVKRTTTTTTRPATATTTKERQVGNDGYIWYKLKKGELYGAQDIEGKEIIPAIYDNIWYESDHNNIHWFRVKKGDFIGGYTCEGKCFVSTDKHYTVLGSGVTHEMNGKIHWIYKKNGTQTGLLDSNGNEVTPPIYDYLGLSRCYDGHSNKIDIMYISICKNELHGACDLDGNIICPAEYETVWLDKWDDGMRIYKKRKGASDGVYEIINYNGNSKFSYDSYDNLFYISSNKSYSSSSSSSSSSPNSSSSSSSASSSSSSLNNNSGSGTTTVVVEHHRDPVPMQEWQACFGCGGMGTMGCDNCGGSGTKYIGDRLHRCSRCNGQGIIPCNICFGSKGKYITVYR